MLKLEFLTNCKTVEELKKAYKKFAVKLHPDLGGNTTDMQKLNAEYEYLFAKLKNIHTSAKSENEVYEKEISKEEASDFIEILDKLLRLKNIEIELCGRWLWISGDTRAVKEELKSYGCKYSPKKKMWSWHFPEDSAMKYKNKKAWEMSQIRSVFGSEKIKKDEEKILIK